MKTIIQEAIDKVNAGAPKFMETVDYAKNNSESVMLVLDAFIDDPELLYACLWYAYISEVEVRMVPKEQLK